MAKEIEIKTLVKQIIDLQTNSDKIMEKELATPKLMRQLYKALGEPDTRDYPDIHRHITRADRCRGYTKYPRIMSKAIMEPENGLITRHINRASETKEAIIRSYTADDWSANVYAYNVMCYKYVPHKDYPDTIWIEFVSTRDCARYEYVLVKEN